MSRDNYKKPLTQAEVDAYVADEPDRMPYGGAGSMSGHARRASKQYTPSDARAKLTAAERAAFVVQYQEATPLTAEQEAHIHAKVAEALKRYDIQQYFANAVRNNVPLETAWSDAGLPEPCPIFKDGVARDGDPVGCSDARVLESMRNFAFSPIFAKYLYRGSDRQSPRFKVHEQVLNAIESFLIVNLISPVLAGSWAFSFALLENLGLLPAPVPTTEQLQAAERSKPADDGNPVYINDATGEPVTYKFKDGRVVRYSKQMLDALPSEGYAKVMNLRAAPKETEEERRGRKSREYRTTVVAGGFTQYELDQMPSEKYRSIMQLERDGGGKVGDRL